jgi:RND family efflux transporter MFP subunit
MKDILHRLTPGFGRIVLTLAIVTAALVAGHKLWVYYQDEPWTRDGKVRAGVVTIAPDVSGLVAEVAVRDNQTVKRGDVLLRIDPERFELALAQADAAMASRKAQMDEAAREATRYDRLNEIAVSREVQEQRETNAAATAAAYRQAVADRSVAELNLRRAVVRSPVDGIVTNVSLEPGDYVSTGKAVMALVDSETLRIEGYFEETKLPEIRVGDRVDVHLMGEPQMLTGRVESIAAGIADSERSDSANLLASVNPTFDWVRLAQRVPVRVKLENVPSDVRLVIGRTATVVVVPGS